MIGRVVEGLVALGVLASAGILAVMLAAPFWSVQTVGLAAPSATAGSSGPAPSATADPSGSAALANLPLGAYMPRGELGLGGLCLGLELGPSAYPVDAGAEGTAIVFVWTSPVADLANPRACEGRAGDLEHVTAVTTRIPDEDDPDGPPSGYSLSWRLPNERGPAFRQEIVMLVAQSGPDLIQALDMTSGGGLVFERVAEIDPPLVPVAGPSPAAALPGGLFLLQGPLGSDGPCLVLELERGPDAVSPGSAAVRWWEPGLSDAADPTACLSRLGDVHDAPAQIAVGQAGGLPSGAVIGYAIWFSLPAADGSGPTDIYFDLPIDGITPDQLIGTAVGAEGARPVVLDRVDAIEPPLASPAP